jgi:bifunctional non-homologous end joining protein LigD
MKTQEFRLLLEELHETSSWKTREKLIRETVLSKDQWKPAVIILAGQRLDDSGIAPKSAIKSLAEAFPTFDSEDEINTLYTEFGTVTDMLIEVEERLPKPEKPNSAVSDIYAALQRVSEKSGNAGITTLAQTFRQFDPVVVSYGILDDYSIGVKGKTVKNAAGRPELSKYELEQKRGLVPDAATFVEQFENGTLPDGPTVTNPFDPMAAKRDLPEDEEWVSQYKLDGYRLVIHIKDGNATGFTRNRKDETQSIPELNQIEWPNGEYIFDCEAVAYSGDTPLGFKETSKRIGRKHNILTDETQIHFKLFDVIYANKNLAEKPFTERFNVLKEIAPEHKYISVIPVYTDISRSLKMAEKNGYEGIIAKKPEGSYRFGKRSNDWRKVKLTDETIDLKIVGFEKEQSSNKDPTLGSVELETADGVSVGNLGTGFTDEQKREIWNNQEDYYEAVIEVQFEGYDDKLRFPSFKYFRPDGEADTLEKLQKLA